MTYAIDLHYFGGTFVPDITVRPVDLNHIDCPSGCGDPMMPISADFFGPDGWPTEPSRLYFGGDDWVTFRDFSVVVSAVPGVSGDYNFDSKVDAADYVVWRKTGINGQQGYSDWRLHFGTTSGSGQAASADAAVPEPATLALLMFTSAGWCLLRRTSL